MKQKLYLSARRFSPLLILSFFTMALMAQGFSPQIQARLQKVVDSIAHSPGYVGGLSAAIKVDDNLAFWQGAAGYAARNIDEHNNLLPGGTPFTTSTLSRIYSVTKLFTAPLVLQLAQEGYFSLDDPMYKYLPFMSAYNPDLDSTVTIRQLLLHESGFQDWEESRDIQMAVAAQPAHKWSVYELIALTKQVAPAGTVRNYSHNNYVFLGAIIEHATGKKVEDLYRERFFEPLHLSSMYLAGRDSTGNRGVLAAPHDNISPFNPIFEATGQPLFPDAYTNISRFPFAALTSLSFTGGGLVSNVADMANWGSALFGGRATSRSILDSILNSISDTPDMYGNKLGYGIKNTRFISGEYNFIGHNGSAPGYRSLLFYQPERKMTIAVLTNFAGVDPYVIANALYNAVPDFLCGNGNRNEDKVQVCFSGNSLCLPRQAARQFFNLLQWWSTNPFGLAQPVFNHFNQHIAYLGPCDETERKPAIVSKEAFHEPGSLSAVPNPFTDRTLLSFTVSTSGPVSVSLYDINGNRVGTFYRGTAEKGTVPQVEIKAGNLPAGVYIAHIQTASGVRQQKLVLTR